MKNHTLYFKLAFFLGIICKVFDDIVDNNLYEQLGISNEIKPFFNESMKGLFIIGYTAICIEYPFFMIVFTIVNLSMYFMCKNDFTPYDFSIFTSSIILIPFVKNCDQENVLANIIWMIISVCATGSVDYVSRFGKKNVEYSNRKLSARLLCLVLVLFAIQFSSSLLVTPDILQLMYSGAGYTFTSCIFQYCLINGILKSCEPTVPPNDVEIKSGVSPPKVLPIEGQIIRDTSKKNGSSSVSVGETVQEN